MRVYNLDGIKKRAHGYDRKIKTPKTNYLRDWISYYSIYQEARPKEWNVKYIAPVERANILREQFPNCTPNSIYKKTPSSEKPGSQISSQSINSDPKKNSLRCGCTGGKSPKKCCSTNRCSCRKANQPCSTSCACKCSPERICNNSDVNVNNDQSLTDSSADLSYHYQSDTESDTEDIVYSDYADNTTSSDNRMIDQNSSLDNEPFNDCKSSVGSKNNAICCDDYEELPQNSNDPGRNSIIQIQGLISVTFRHSDFEGKMNDNIGDFYIA